MTRLASLARGAALVVGVAALAALGLTAGAFAGFQRSSTDLLQPTGSLDERIVVVGIDADALAAEGMPWPWPRDLQARLVTALDEAGAAAIGLDVVYAESTAGDATLAAAIDAAAAPVAVVAVPSGLEPTGGRVDLLRAVTLAEPTAAVAGPSLLAHAVVTEDRRDGVARSTPLVIEAPDGRFVPSLALLLAAVADGADPVPVVRPGAVQVGDLAAPTEDGHALTVAYADGLDVGGRVSYVSAAAVLQGDLEPGALRDAIVLVGVADPTLGDHHRTPLDRGSGEPGVFVHAQALNTLLSRTFLDPVSDLEIVLWCALLAAIVVAVTQRFHLRWAPVVTVLVVGGYLALTSLRFDGGVVMDPLYPPVAALVALGGGLGLRYLVETRHRRRVSALFSRYVPATVADQLLADDERVAAVLAGQRLPVAVLFCDLRGFTPLSRTLPAEDLRRLLDTYYQHVTEPILERDGTVVQFTGDEVYAVFGAPLPRDDREQAALDCARAMQDAREELAAELATMGLPPVRYGISVHTGEGVAAEVGTSARSQYSVIGDVVNVASRLCSIADADAVVASATVAEACTDTGPLAPVGAVDLKGVDEPVPIWAAGPVRNVVVRS